MPDEPASTKDPMMSHATYRYEALATTTTLDHSLTAETAPPLHRHHVRIDYRLAGDMPGFWRCVDLHEDTADGRTGDALIDLVYDIVEEVHGERYEVDDCSCEPYIVSRYAVHTEEEAVDILTRFFERRDGFHPGDDCTWRVYAGERGYSHGVPVAGEAFRIYGEN